MDKVVAKKADKYMKTLEAFADVIYQMIDADGLADTGKFTITIGKEEYSYGTVKANVRFETGGPHDSWFDNTMNEFNILSLTEKGVEEDFNFGWNNLTSGKIKALVADKE